MDRTTLPTQSEQTDGDFSGVSRRSFEAPWVVADGGTDWTSAIIVSDPPNLPKNIQILSMQPLPTLHLATTMGHSPESSGTIQPAARRPATSTLFGEPILGYNYDSSTLTEPGTRMLLGQGREDSTFASAVANHCIQLTEEIPRTVVSRMGTSGHCQPLVELSQLPNTPMVEHLPSFTALPIDLHSSNQTISSYTQQGTASTVEAGNQRGRYPEYIWDFYKPIIEHHYLYEDKKLSEVIQIMADRCAFQASPKMYKTRFAKWGFRKNITDKEARILLNVKWQRENEGKTTLFLRPNKVVKLKRHVQRKNKPEYDIVDLTQVAECPARLICRTPSPIPQFSQSQEFQDAKGKLIASITTVFKTWHEEDLRDGTRPLHTRLRRTGDDMIGRLTRASIQLQRGNVYEGDQLLSLVLENLEADLSGRSPIATMRLIFEHQNWTHSGMIFRLWRYIAEYSPRHPLSTGLRAIHSILQSQRGGVPAFRDLLDDCAEKAAEQIERIYGESHPVTLGCWDLVEMFYSNKNPRRIGTIYDRLREHHEFAEATFGPGSLEELDLRYCYAFHLCYGRQSKHEEAAKYLSELLKVLRDGKNQDNALAEWCLRSLANLNHEVSSGQDPCFIPQQRDASYNRRPSMNVGMNVEPGEEKFGRHGDLKPENILWFDDFEGAGPGGILQIADLGLGRFHGMESRSNQNPANINGSPTYSPPGLSEKVADENRDSQQSTKAGTANEDNNKYDNDNESDNDNDNVTIRAISKRHSSSRSSHTNMYAGYGRHSDDWLFKPLAKKSSQLGPETAREQPYRETRLFHGRHSDMVHVHFSGHGTLTVNDLIWGGSSAAGGTTLPERLGTPQYRPPEY